MEDLENTVRKCSWPEIVRNEIAALKIKETEEAILEKFGTGYLECYRCNGATKGCKRKLFPINPLYIEPEPQKSDIVAKVN